MHTLILMGGCIATAIVLSLYICTQHLPDVASKLYEQNRNCVLCELKHGELSDTVLVERARKQTPVVLLHLILYHMAKRDLISVVSRNSETHAPRYALTTKGCSRAKEVSHAHGFS